MSAFDDQYKRTMDGAGTPTQGLFESDDHFAERNKAHEVAQVDRARAEYEASKNPQQNYSYSSYDYDDSSTSTYSSEKKSEKSDDFPWVVVGIIIYLLIGVGLAEWSDAAFGFEYLFMVLVGPILGALILAFIIAIISGS